MGTLQANRENAMFGKEKYSNVTSMKIGLLRSCWRLPAMFLIMASSIRNANCEAPPVRPATSSKVVIQTLEIIPSHDGGYEGKFRLLNQGVETLELDCSEGPINQRFLPNNIDFQVLKNGVWTQVPTQGYQGAMSCAVPPGIPVELHVNLSPFKEQDEPLTGRVVFNGDQFPSEPFKLDWKSDRKAGKFLAAKKAHAGRLRAAFLKSGFRPELLKGDDFPTRFVNDMIAAVVKSGEAGKWFGLYNKEMEFDATLMWKGDVNIIFSSVGGPGNVGILQWNPEKLNRALIRKLRKTDGFAEVTVDEKSGRHSGLVIIIDPDDPIDPKSLDYIVRPFEMRLSVSLAESDAESLPMPNDGDAQKALDSAMDFLERCLTR